MRGKGRLPPPGPCLSKESHAELTPSAASNFSHVRVEVAQRRNGRDLAPTGLSTLVPNGDGVLWLLEHLGFRFFSSKFGVSALTSHHR